MITKKGFRFLFVAILGLTVLFTFMQSRPVKAYACLPSSQQAGCIPLIPDPADTTIPRQWEDFLRNCRSQGSFTPSLVQWISPTVNPATESITVAYGTPSIGLTLHYAGAVCYNTQNVTRYRTHVSSSSVLKDGAATTATATLSNQTSSSLTFSPYNQVGRYVRDTGGTMNFTLKGPTSATCPSGCFTSTTSAPHTYRVTAQFQGINSLTPSGFACTKQPGDPNNFVPSSDLDFSGCSTYPANLDLSVTIAPDTVPRIWVNTPDCGTGHDTSISVTSSDADSNTRTASYGFTAQLYTETSAGSGVYTLGQTIDDTNSLLYGTLVGTHHTITWGSPPNRTLGHYVKVTTDGYGIPHTKSYGGPGITSWPACPSIPAFQTPYLLVYGNDVFAGGGISYDNTIPCDVNGAADIKTQWGTSGQVGSGGQFAAFAMGIIQEYSTAKLRLSGSGLTNPSLPSGLSFANTPALGNFGSASCNTNFQFSTSGTPFPLANPAVLDTLPGGTYYKNGLLTIGSNGGLGNTIPEAGTVTIYVNGDVIINGDIKYASTGTWANATRIPSFTLIAKGNIYIDQGVTTLTGNYIAEGDLDTQGVINTCSNNSGSTTTPWANTQLYAQCGAVAGTSGQLTIYGTLLANYIKWQRTFGKLGNATQTENPYDGSTNANCSKPTCASEVVIDGPEDYISVPISNTYGTVNSITALPPIL